MTNLPAVMSGVVLTGHGDLDQLVYRTDLPMPVLAATDVLIRVKAAGVNNTDLNTRLAWYSKGDADDADATWSGKALTFPHVQGADVCGEIVAVGADVDPTRIGDRVIIEPSMWEVNGEVKTEAWYFGSETWGGFAEYTKVSTQYAHKIDSGYSEVELASFPCSYSTAENMLTRAKVGAGDRVLITGASGGVGSAALQLCKARGAAVIAQTSGAKAAYLREIGADDTVDRAANLIDALGNNSVDVVIDLVAGDAFPSLLDVLKSKGRYATSGAIGGAMVELDVRTLYLKDLSFFGATVLEPEVFPNLVKLIEAEKIKPLVAETYPLKDIAAAQTNFATKKHVGKIVLEV